MSQAAAPAKHPLTADAVTTLWDACFAREGDGDQDLVRIEGATMEGRLSTTRIRNSAPEILELLLELPEKFRQSSGSGGWTMINACADRHGRFWTSEMRTVDKLVILGLAAGLVHWTLERAHWYILPSGMPYFRISDGKRAG